MTEITCPYCDFTQEEPDECYEEDVLYEAMCNNCGKVYGITPYYIKGYYERIMPCANDEPHKFVKLYTSREGEWEHCEYCGTMREKPVEEKNDSV